VKNKKAIKNTLPLVNGRTTNVDACEHIHSVGLTL